MHTILILASNPSDTGRLALDREARSIKERLRSASHGAHFRVEQEESVRLRDLCAAITRFKPSVVHFCGHGSAEGELLVESDTGAAVPLDTRAVAELFEEFASDIRCVVLNACHSAEQATLIAQYVDCVVGMRRSVTDSTAIAFASAFYQTLGFGESIRRAFRLGVIEAGLSGASDRDVPQLLSKSGVDAENVRLP